MTVALLILSFSFLCATLAIVFSVASFWQLGKMRAAIKDAEAYIQSRRRRRIAFPPNPK